MRKWHALLCLPAFSTPHCMRREEKKRRTVAWTDREREGKQGMYMFCMPSLNDNVVVMVVVVGQKHAWRGVAFTMLPMPAFLPSALYL